jgi:hypothetical protein
MFIAASAFGYTLQLTFDPDRPEEPEPEPEPAPEEPAAPGDAVADVIAEHQLAEADSPRPQPLGFRPSRWL